MGHPFFFMANILGSDRGAQFSFLQRGLTRSVLGIKALQVLHPWFRIIGIHSGVRVRGYKKISFFYNYKFNISFLIFMKKRRISSEFENRSVLKEIRLVK